MKRLNRLVPYGYRATAATIALLFTIALFPIAAHADGGAPQLAYVAGTPKGISIIDIQQQKVTGTISVQGDPHGTMLSLDGRYLYITQPALGQFMYALGENRTDYLHR